MENKNKPMQTEYKSSKKVFFLAVLFLVAFGVSICSSSKAATTDATLFFNPTSASATVGGSNVTYVARVNPGSNMAQGVNAVQLNITFTPSVVHLVSVSAAGTFAIMSAPDIAVANSSGTLSVALFIGGGQVTSTSDVATLVFSPQTVGTNSPIAFAATANAAVNDGSGTYVVATRTGATVTVASSGLDTTPPVRSAASVGTLAAGTTQRVISMTSNENATCKYSTQSGIAYDSMPSMFTTTGTTSHSFVASNLIDGGNYGYFVRCQDVNNNSNSDDYLISFSVAATASKTSSTPSSDGGNGKKKNSSSNKKKTTTPRKITNSRKSVKRGVNLIQRGKKFSKSSLVQLYFSKPGGGYYAPQKIKTSSSGGFMLTYRVAKPAGRYSWYALDTKTGKKSRIIYYTVK